MANVAEPKNPEKATERVLLKLTPSELAAIETAAEAHPGYTTRSGWIKGLLAAAAKHQAALLLRGADGPP